MGIEMGNRMSEIEKLSNLLESILDNIFENMDIDAHLDKRVSPPFDNQWVKAYQEIEMLKSAKPISCEGKKEVDYLSKRAYMLTYNKSNSFELASYVSDDFRLIGEAIILNNNSYWISSLLSSYMNGKKTQQKFNNVEISINKLFED